ncbi:hypothetical protein AMECASPLE_007863 [Ameca splendens]|uniref:Uncharacterized protein n=1 Tax=Ameca splendens TaxID=208324 RepID=A0ABV0XNR0_9TELE
MNTRSQPSVNPQVQEIRAVAECSHEIKMSASKSLKLHALPRRVLLSKVLLQMCQENSSPMMSYTNIRSIMPACMLNHCRKIANISAFLAEIVSTRWQQSLKYCANTDATMYSESTSTVKKTRKKTALRLRT